MGYEKKWWMIWTQASIISCLVLYELCYVAKTNKLVWPLHSSPLMIIYVTTSKVLSAARIRFTGQFQGYSQWAPNVTEIIIEQTWIKTASLLNLKSLLTELSGVSIWGSLTISFPLQKTIYTLEQLKIIPDFFPWQELLVINCQFKRSQHQM